MKNIKLPTPFTRSNMVFFSGIYALALVLVLLLFSPTIRAGAKVEFSRVSHASLCASAARQAVIFDSASREDVAVCTIAIRTERLSKHDLAMTYINRGVLNKKRHQLEAALRDYYRSRNLERNFASVYINIGNVFFSEQQYDRAVRFYNKALTMEMERQRTNGAALVNRGLANERLGNIEQAIEDYRAASQLLPDLALPQEGLLRLSVIQLSEQTVVGTPSLYLSQIAY